MSDSLMPSGKCDLSRASAEPAGGSKKRLSMLESHKHRLWMYEEEEEEEEATDRRS